MYLVSHGTPVSFVLASCFNGVGGQGHADAEPLGECPASSSVFPSYSPGYMHRLAHAESHNASELEVISMLTKYSPLLRELPRPRYQHIGEWNFVAHVIRA